MSFFFNRGNNDNVNRVNRHTPFILTETGREKLMSIGGDNKAWQILATLESSGGSSMDMDEIAQASKLSKGAVEHIMHRLERAGYVSIVGVGVE